MNLFDMNVPEIPKKEFLMHNKMDNLSEDQRFWWDALVRLSDVLSLTMREKIQRTTGAYLPMLFTDFLDRLYEVIHAERRHCGKEFVFDDFINIAKFSVSALKHIVSSPSTYIVKSAEKVHVSSLRQTSSKTMQWMSKRPGRSIQEKIAPQNKVMTNVTRFSVDTKENRESMYLYSILHDIVRDRVKDTDCLSCMYSNTCIVPIKDIRDLLGLHAKIRHGDLADVPAEKQSMQNNKLMCDINYKMIWDGVKQLSRIEESLAENWEHLRERYLQLAYWAVLADIIHDTDTLILDQYGTLRDESGLLCFGDPNSIVPNSIQIYPKDRPWEPLLLELTGSELVLYEGNPYQEVLFFDLASVHLEPAETIETVESSSSFNSDIDLPSDGENGYDYLPDLDNINLPTTVDEEIIIPKKTKSEDSIPLGDSPLFVEPSPDSNEPNSSSPNAEEILENKKTYSVGETIIWGAYRQSVSSPESYPLEWHIIDIQGNRAMLISKKAIDCRIINRSSKVTDWAHTDLCTWLNSDFLMEAFTKKEILALLPIPEESSRIVTLISQEEAEKVIKDEEIRTCFPTEYALSKGAKHNSEGRCPYWTRTLNIKQSSAIIVSGSGNYRKMKYQMDFAATRPVIYLDLSSLR